MFELVDSEVDTMVSQNVIPNRGVFGGAAPMAFTEQGVAMLSSVLQSPQAVAVNIAIMGCGHQTKTKTPHWISLRHLKTGRIQKEFLSYF